MRIRLANPDRVRDLVRFLRGNGCIAYGVADVLTVEAIRPHALGEREEQELRELLARWQADNPDAEATIA